LLVAKEELGALTKCPALGTVELVVINNRRHRLKPMLRVVAAMSLMFWLAAFTFCSTECLHADADHMEQATAADHHDSHDSSKEEQHDDSFCISLHSFAPSSAVSELAKPDFRLVLTLNLLLPTPQFSIVEPKLSISRQPPDREWPFTPEVCLGPAFRSLAPPSLA